eukprot:172563-Prorocentrum_minimum.AAC.1
MSEDDEALGTRRRRFRSGIRLPGLSDLRVPPGPHQMPPSYPPNTPLVPPPAGSTWTTTHARNSAATRAPGRRFKSCPERSPAGPYLPSQGEALSLAHAVYSIWASNRTTSTKNIPCGRPIERRRLRIFHVGDQCPLGLHAAIKPLIRPFTTGEFNQANYPCRGLWIQTCDTYQKYEYTIHRADVTRAWVSGVRALTRRSA